MSTLRTLAWVGVGIATIHGFIYRQTGELNPCSGATKRLIQEYHLSGAVGFGPDYLDTLPHYTDTIPDSSGYASRSPKDREITAKSETLDPFGIVGCYVPAVLGWWAVPPITNTR
jgi:hypothetical protein